MCIWLLALVLHSGTSDQEPMTRGEAIALAEKILEREHGIDPDDVERLSATEVSWPSTALGCAQPGRDYERRTIAGFRVVLEAAGKAYRFHVGEGEAVLCGEPLPLDRGSAVEPPEHPEREEERAVEEPSSPVLQKLVRQAKEDLSDRIDFPAESIELLGMEATEWPDASLGCPQPGMLYAQVIQEGHRIRLRAGGKIYEYHSGRSGRPFLCEEPR